MLEGHAAGIPNLSESEALGEFFASWPTPFEDPDAARAFLGRGALVDALIADLESTPSGLMPRFDADVMQRTLEAVHKPRWREWEELTVPTLAVFGARGMFSADQQEELLRRRPDTEWIVLRGGSLDAHLDAFDQWVDVLRAWLARDTSRSPVALRWTSSSG